MKNKLLINSVFAALTVAIVSAVMVDGGKWAIITIGICTAYLVFMAINNRHLFQVMSDAEIEDLIEEAEIFGLIGGDYEAGSKTIPFRKRADA